MSEIVKPEEKVTVEDIVDGTFWAAEDFRFDISNQDYVEALKKLSVKFKVEAKDVKDPGRMKLSEENKDIASSVIIGIWVGLVSVFVSLEVGVGVLAYFVTLKRGVRSGHDYNRENY